jgi:hypothetical protein
MDYNYYTFRELSSFDIKFRYNFDDDSVLVFGQVILSLTVAKSEGSKNKAEKSFAQFCSQN